MLPLHKFVGPRDRDVLDPETMVYRVQPAINKKNQCKGCAFERQAAAVCRAASARAVSAGLEDCDAGFIYVMPDPRQTDCEQQQNELKGNDE